MARVIEENGSYVLRDDWHLDDVYQQADAMKVEITYDQAVEVLHCIAESMDANRGINWETIELAIEIVAKKHKE